MATAIQRRVSPQGLGEENREQERGEIVAAAECLC
jgi:hypothetical protein